ncbi:MAG: aminotransferase class V-fold PLP-dependent enzyme [Candidatus Krumholzibacteria bacterium]|nr:aminotransferase class V-fold PLP-dependent enzyme [Candidatus Krumholzibacteria bacterium]MDH4337298.1 aminotransferase class V-fold PLP-dependent enzyme [Candidatus Krumholzibacteria bacterium]MDH5269989.1 aminotransferase class V-fold PLP-dependent enzyme [Candidatus Krumholzibacteria bacterium]
MQIDSRETRLLEDAINALAAGFENLPPAGERPDTARIHAALLEAAGRLHDNFPYHHPLYIGQMLKPPHPVARLAYVLAMCINPNNHALDGGRASSRMEKEAVAELARMLGWREHLGHLSAGGTMANFEALWIARELAPGKTVLASSQAHYTHPRLSAVLGVPFAAVQADARGRMKLDVLRGMLAEGGVGTVVATVGTTATGSVDPLREIIDLARNHGVRVHVDAAYAGYFTLADNLGEPARRAFDAMGDADSVVIDPHKHGLQPYGCGCVLFRDPSVGRFYKHDSPYTYFSSGDLHLGEISLECSRPGAAAVALWTTMRMLPLERGGEFARGLEAGREAALVMYRALCGDARFAPLFEPELDIVVWAVRAETSREASAAASALFKAAAGRDLHLALATMPRNMVEPAGAVKVWDTEEIVCLRACAMKPEHREWMPEILKRLGEAALA